MRVDKGGEATDCIYRGSFGTTCCVEKGTGTVLKKARDGEKKGGQSTTAEKAKKETEETIPKKR